MLGDMATTKSKVQSLEAPQVFVLRDVVFEEGHPHCMSLSVEENEIPLFDVALGIGTLDEGEAECQTDQQTDQSTN
jgi:hypothetical protein